MGGSCGKSAQVENNKYRQSDPQIRQMLIQNRGLLKIKLKVPIYDSYSLSLVYTPGVGESCLKIKENIEDAYLYTNIGNSLAVVTDGSGYKNNQNSKWSNNACIPQLEAQSLIYKVYSNIDAYPFIIDPALAKSDEEFVTTLQALSGTVAAIELFNISEHRLSSLIPMIRQKRLKLAILTQKNRQYIKNFSNLKNLNEIYITSTILRAVLDCRFRGIIENDFIDSILSQIANDGQQQSYDEWKYSSLIHKHVVNSIFSSNWNNGPLSKESIISRFNNFQLQGNSAYMVEVQETNAELPLIEKSLLLHQKFSGMMKTSSKIKPKQINKLLEMNMPYNYESLEQEIMKTPVLVRELTFKANWCAIITNGTAVLGFGDIGATAGLPVMEGKSCIFKQLGGVDVVPICIQEKDPKKLIDIILRLSPIFSAINLEDIKAPQCFEVEDTLKEKLDIPVFHDDQHGTAIVVASAVINALKLMDKKASEVKLIVNGGGAAGLSITQLLLDIGVVNIIICDTSGAIYKGRPKNMNPQKEQLAKLTNPHNIKGSLEQVIDQADIFIGVSAAGALKPEWAAKMTKKNLILAMANPIPEIMPEEAKKAGAYIVGTGRSDFKNQTNNSLAFPGIFRGTLDVQATNITQEMKLAAAYAIANLIPENELNPDYIIPSSLDTNVPIAVSKAVGLKAIEQGIAKKVIGEKQLEQNIRGYLVERNLSKLNN